MKAVNYLHSFVEGDRAWIMYEGVTTGKRYCNTELYTVHDGKITEALVFFGWDVPHQAPEGRFIENDGEGHA